MAEADYYNSPQRLVSEMGSPKPQTQTNPSKFYYHFISRGLFIVIFIAILPLFPSQAPEFINQTILTRSWELLHLLFVGIAVSYGLFSRWNIESEKENQLQIDNAQTYVSRILEVPSVFDDEDEHPSGLDESKIQAWNSQYFRGEPVVMVAKESSGLGNHSKSIRRGSDKPLLLPVRSLKSRVSDPVAVDLDNGVDEVSGSGNGSGSVLEDFSNTHNKMRNGIGEIGGSDALNFEEKSKESVVLPSPIPWRSRSGRMEFKDETCTGRSPSYSLQPSVDDAIEFDKFESPSLRSPTHWSPRPNLSPTPSPKKLSPSPSLSPEMRAKIGEDVGKKKSTYKSSPPPPPPLPPPIIGKSPPNIPNSNPVRGEFPLSDMKDMRRSFRKEMKELNRSSREDLPTSKDLSTNSLRLETKHKHHHPEGLLTGKSVRTIKGGEYAMEARKGRDNGEGAEISGVRRSKEVDAFGAEKSGTRTGSIQSSIGIEKPTRAVHFAPPKNQKKVVAEEIITDSEDSDGGESHESSDGEVSASTSAVDVGRDANEVDKKADEFIAKFREQIRLQRIASIKRSSGMRSSRKPR